MHLKNVPLKKYQCLSESVEAVCAFIMIGSGNPMVKARRIMSCCEKEEM
jgi:hypothetical protein